jgi:proline iminopeptidase
MPSNSSPSSRLLIPAVRIVLARLGRMAELYPPIEPYEHGMLDVGNGNRVYWEICGNPAGKPAVLLHGGPGSGSSPGMRRGFDPARYRAVLFDQRGSGRSTPHASDPATRMEDNTTQHLIGDMERLREHLGIERWLVTGGSWGSTLALAYAEQYPERVGAIVLAAVTTTRRWEIDWLYRGVGRFFPGEWQRFREGVPEHQRDGDLVAAYAGLMEHPDMAVRERAARDWCRWEDAVLSGEPEGSPAPYSDRPDAARLAFVRICSRYFAHGAWLEEGALIRSAGRLAGIPGVLIHGRRDLSSPLDTAWELAQAWPEATLHVLEASGHQATDESRSRLLASLAGFADAAL